MNKTFTILEDNSLNTAMINGLLDALRYDLKQSLMPEAEKQVDAVVESLCKRFEVKLNSMYPCMEPYPRVRLDWLLTKDTSL